MSKYEPTEQHQSAYDLLVDGVEFMRSLRNELEGFTNPEVPTTIALRAIGDSLSALARTAAAIHPDAIEF